MNNHIDLHELAKRESERVEWKENVANIGDVIKTIVAFANDYSNLGGGYVVCGAKEGRDVHGFQAVIYQGITANRLREVREKTLSECRRKVDPEIVPRVEELPVPGDGSKRILVFIIPATNYAHSYRAGRRDASTYYIRSGSNTIEARNGLLRELLVRKRQIEPWDRRINAQSSIEQIDLIIFRDYLREMGLWSSRKALEDYISDTEKLSDFTPPLAGKIGLDPMLRLRNFAILMFGNKPLDFFYGAYAVFSTYKAHDRSEPTGERQLITGTIIQQARRLIELLNAESYTTFDKAADTPNQVNYPTIALKEAVVNALVHRDYESDQPVRVTIFVDRIEIFSPGGLPCQVDQEKFKAGRATAYWRNQALNYLFNRLQLAQAEGQGIPTILKAMQEEGCPPPVFEIEPESVTCILPAHPRHQILKELHDVENKIVLRNYTAAYDTLVDILEKDVYNYRALELFCEVNNLLETPQRVYEFIQTKNFDLQRINPGTLIVIAETLASNPGNKEIAELADNLLTKAIAGRLEEKHIIKVASSLKKLGENEKVERFITDIFMTHPNLSKNPSLLQQRARARIDLAKICEQSAKDTHHTRHIKEKAWGRLRKYLKEAEQDLSNALECAESPKERDWLRRDLHFLHEMKQASQKSHKRKIALHKIYVSNLPVQIDKEELTDIFLKYGAIDAIDILKTYTEDRKNFAFIVFKHHEGVKNALRDRKSIFLRGNKLFISKYRPGKKR